MRLVTDYEKHLILTSASEIRESLDPKAKWYAPINLLHGYYQVRLTKRVKRNTAFLMNFGQGAHLYMYLQAGTDGACVWWMTC